jgi:hypothetical protein
VSIVATCERCGYHRQVTTSLHYVEVRLLGTEGPGPLSGGPEPCAECKAWADAPLVPIPTAATEPLPSIEDEFTCAGGVLRDDCPHCRGSGYVCEEHPDRPWYPTTSLEDGACGCGAPGMPCKDGPAFEEDLP